MLSNLPFSAPFAVVAALAPALLRWSWGRRLAPLAGDPAFPERLAAHRLRAGRSFGVSGALLLILFTDTLLWSGPLLVLSCMVASFPFRRTIYRETWGLGAYLSFLARAIVGIFGFWLVLVWLPTFASMAGSRDWLVALTLGLLLVAWNARYTDSVRVLMRATPIDNPPLVARFAALTQISTARPPIFEQVPLRGGAIVNAIALPSLRRSAVLFTDSLLSRLDDDEIVAICGHELAHVEHFNRERLKRINLVNLLLIAGSLVVVAIERLAASSSFASPSIFWPVVVVGTLAYRVRDRQKHETESDLRAVALTGDPEALARALIKIHAFAHLPRRTDAEHEQHASHPSLARRIKAIRATTPGPTPVAGTSASFTAPDGRTQVTFGERHLEWREGEHALHSLSYAHLTQLRVSATSPTSVRLLVVERSGQQWSIPLADADVARAQAALDQVDCQLADTAPTPGLGPVLQRVFTLFAVSFAVLVGQVVVAMLAMVAFLRPAAPLVAAGGAALIAGAALALRQPDWAGLKLQPWVSLGLAVTGGMLLWSAWQRRETASPSTVNRLVAGIGALAAVALIAALSEGSGIIRVHQAARSLPAVVVLPLAFAAALACYSGWRPRVAAVTAVIAGLAMATVGAVPFLDRFGTDPLLLPSEALTTVRVTGTPSAEFTLPFVATDVRLSPGGLSVAARDMREYRVRERQPMTFHIGRLGAPLTPVVADEVFFLDDERVLLLDEGDTGVRLEERSVGQLDAVVWQQRVPGLADGKLSIERASREWRLLGWDTEGRLVRARGTMGEEPAEITRWISPLDEPGWSTATAASGSHALLVDTTYDLATLGRGTLVHMFAALGPSAMVSHLWHLADDGPKDLGTSALTSECVASTIGDARLICSAYDGTRTRIVAIDPSIASITSLGTFAGRFMSDHHAPPGWLTGWCDLLPCAVRLATRELFTLPGRQHAVLGFTSSDRLLGLIAVDGTRSTLRLFALQK